MHEPWSDTTAIVHGTPWVRSTTRWVSDGTWQRNDIHHDTAIRARTLAHQIRLDLDLDPPPDRTREPEAPEEHGKPPPTLD